MKKPGRVYAFDTETVNRPGGGYSCLNLCENIFNEVDFLEFPENFGQTFQMLAPRKRLIAFNAAFDVRAILHPKFIPEKNLNELAEFDCTVFKGFRFFHIPGKYLKCWLPGNGGFELFDIKSFFQGNSLRSAAEKYLKTARKIDIPQSWYSEMDKCLRDKRREKVLNYAAQDVKVLSELYNVLNDSFVACGIENPPLYSPGAVAMVVFGDDLKKQAITDAQNKFFMQAFRAGRIEISEMGLIKGPLNYADLKSAYPAVIAELPDLKSALYRQGGADWKWQGGVKAGAYRVNVEIPVDWQFGPFALWTKQNIIFPVGKFETWIGKDGIDICREFKIKFQVLEYGEFYGGFETKPFRQKILKLFALRSDPKKSLAIKLILNSLYGKMAERDNYNQCLPEHLADIFSRYFNSERLYGKFTNFAYAGIITERTRLKLWRQAHKSGAVILATDGIITRGKIDLGTGLGQWENKGIIEKAVILGCGRYSLKFKGEKLPEYHLRGFSRPGRIFKKMAVCAKEYITEKILDTKSLKQWNNAIEKADFNVLKDIKKDIYIEDLKRAWPEHFPRIKDYFKKSIKSNAINLL